MSDFCGNYKKYNIQITKKHRDITKKQFFIQLGLRNAWHNEGTKGEADPLPAGAEPSQSQTQKGKIHMKKNLIRTGTAIITTAALTLGAVTPAFAAVSGDTNASGSFDLADVVAFTQFLTGDENALNDPAAADFNSDGKLNAKDLTLMKRALIYGQQGSGNDDPPVTTDDTYVTQITYAASSVTLKNANDEVVPAASASNVTVENGTVVTVTKPTSDGTNDFGDINVDGECANGQLKVNVDEATYATGQVTINLRGVTLSNSSDSPIYIEQIADECVITVKNGTTNTISDGTSYTNADGSQGAIYSLDDLKFKGKGTLIVKGNAGDGIVGKDDIKIWNGDLQVTAVDDGIRGKDSIRIGDPDDTDYSTLSVKVVSTGGDALKTTNDTADSGKGYIKINGGTLNLRAENGDGIQAEQEVYINGGDLTVYTYQGSNYGSSTGSTGGWGGGMGMDGNPNKTDISAKGIKAVGLYDEAGTTWQSMGNIYITGGTLSFDTSDDAIHCGGNLSVTGGVMTIATADDALHSDHTLTIGTQNSGKYDDVQILVTKCYEGVEGVTINQNSGTVYIVSGDDGYNAAGGADGSGTGGATGPGAGWGQGGMSTSSGTLNLNGGFAVVNSANGDHDAFDSNGAFTINGGYYVANGQEPMDYDGTFTQNGGTYVTMTAGNTNLGTTYTFKDASGNAVITFKCAAGSPGISSKDNSTCFSGTSASGGTTLFGASNYPVILGGSVSGGTQVTGSASGGGQPGGRW